MSDPEPDDWKRVAELGAEKRDRASAGTADWRATPPWTPASASIPARILQQLIDLAREGAPNEACGLLAARNTAEDGGVPSRFLRMRNAEESPYRYRMDPQELLTAILDIEDGHDEVVWGIFHSHVASRPEPSVTDVGLAAYPDALYLICSLAVEPPETRAWSIRDGKVSEIVLQIV